MKENIWHRFRGYLAAGLALIACPCHLLVTLPLLLSVTAGTGVGVYLEQNPGVVVVVSIIVFIGGLAMALRWLGSGGSEGAACSTQQSRKQMNRPTQAGSLRPEKEEMEL